MKVVPCDLVILNNLWKFEEIMYGENWEKSEKLVFSSKLPMFYLPRALQIGIAGNVYYNNLVLYIRNYKK